MEHPKKLLKLLLSWHGRNRHLLPARQLTQTADSTANSTAAAGQARDVHRHRLAAFSLAEIAIALAVVGVMVAGALKGLDILESAKIKSIVMQCNRYRYAVQAFSETYGALPGDFTQASEVLDARLKDGDGDGIIGGDGFTLEGGRHESASFWQHLAYAGFIDDVAAAPVGPRARYGFGLPETRLGGGIILQHQPAPNLVGHWLIIGRAPDQRGRGGLVSPAQAMRLVRAFGERDPQSGRTVIASASDAPAAHPCYQAGKLNYATKHKSCIVLVKLD